MASRFHLLLAVSAAFLVVSDLSASPLITRKLGGEQTAIGGGVSGAQISPDGRYAVYRGDLIDEGVQELFSIPISGGPPVKISSGQYIFGTPFLHISPDSEWVYFLSNGKIFRTPIDGSAPPALSHGELGFYNPEFDNWITRGAHFLQLGRDGRYLYFFVSSYTGNGLVPHGVYRTDIFRIDLVDHSPAENITDGTALSKLHMDYGFEASDDGQSLLVKTLSDGGEYGSLCRIFHLDLTSASATLLPTPDYVAEMKLSPDGNRALIDWREEIIDASLRQFPPLAEPEIITDARPLDFEYSPDSRWILFRTANGLFKRPTEGGEVSLIAQRASAQFFDADDRLVFTASSTVGEATVTHLFSVQLDEGTPPVCLTQHPLVAIDIQLSPDRRSALFLEQVPNPDGDRVRRLVLARTDGATQPQLLGDPGVELPEYPIYRSAMFTGQSGRVIYTKGDLYDTAAIYSVAAGSPPQLVTQIESGSSLWPSPTTADTELSFFYQSGNLFAHTPGAGPATKLSFSAAIGADVSAVKLTPDGTQAVFLLDAEIVGRRELFAASIDGGNRRKLSHQLDPKPSEESVNDFWIRPNGQVIYSTSLRSIYSGDVGGTSPPVLLQDRFGNLGPNTDGKFLLGFSGRQLAAIDLEAGTSAITAGPEGEVMRSNDCYREPQPYPDYLLQSSKTRAIYISARVRGSNPLMSWPLDGSTPPVNLGAGDPVYQFTMAPAIDRVIYRTRFGAIYSVPPGGGNRLQLLESDDLPIELNFFSVTADGSWLIYGHGNSMWKVSTSAGGSAVNLTAHLSPDQSIVSVVIASSGTEFAYAAATPPRGLSVYSVGLEGEPTPQQVFTTDARDNRTKLVSAGDQLLLFASGADNDFKLFSLPSEPGSPPAILNSNDDQRTSPLKDNFVLSADQSRIVFVEVHWDLFGRVSYELVTAPVDGSERATVIAPGRPPQFAINFDGSAIAYISNRENPTIDELFVTKLNSDPNSYDGWLTLNFPPEELAEPAREPDLWHRNADPDADGIENWLERLTGLNPLEAERVAPYELILDADAKRSLQFRSAKNLSLLPIVECSADLVHWKPAASTVRVVSDTSQAWLLETEVDGVGSDRVYVRLREGR